MLELPLFPLDLILLPYEYLPLHIFEPRYKKMIKNAIDSDNPFGIILSQGDDVFSKGVRVNVTEVFREYKNGEYDILVKGQELFNVVSTKLDGDTVVGEIEYIPIEAGLEGSHFQDFQDSYLKVLLKFGVDKDLNIHMNKKISFEFLQGLQLPLALKKELININDETERLIFINNIFNDILNANTEYSNGDMPEA
ncbi:MAG: LON peptidase substrate-binding domain-containing protein [Candidatus Marinimicrobia bacterium]|jgi:Lon protease-like protein|nr:LON peptidase substrate-binding domain-containing protein [Candidatus Neomarinimicrobiota bacterium]|tara:strand:- start:1646 stop:2230 length:585 start_codon:yes stop_codon:yes gene_type:complete